MVFAGGQGYIINPDEQKPLLTFGLTITDVIQKDDGSLICSDDIHILVLDNKTGEFWKSPRVSWDGIRDLRVIGTQLHGQTFDPTSADGSWIDFSLDLNTKEIKGGSYQEFLLRNPHLELQENGTLRYKTSSSKKPWWKIW